MSKGYNGWSNYETWCVALWLDNEEGSYHACRAMASECRHRELPRVALADALKAWLEAAMPDLGASLWSDLLAAALGETDWHELACSYLDEED